MDTKWKILAVTLAFGLLGFAIEANGPLGPAIWGAAPESGAEPTGAQLPLLIVVGVTEALAFGLGFAFLLFGWTRVANAPGVSKALGTAAAAAIAWGLLSWVPHSAMHITNAPDDFGRLIFIEYAFHVTLIVAAAVLALFAYRASARPAAGAARAAPAPATR